ERVLAATISCRAELMEGPMPHDVSGVISLRHRDHGGTEQRMKNAERRMLSGLRASFSSVKLV
ncbi:MAG: hypothetical protein ACKOKC_16710, partial [Chthoniobacterales bacterium]